MAEEKFAFESMQDTQSIKVFLESLIQGFENGKVTLAAHGDRIELAPEGLLAFTVKARRYGDSSKLTIKIGWKESHTKPDSADNELSVTTG
ncbi:amphi-Trp domain-containing protein [Desulfovibrio mangrovi]|uniref:amphi-Trp domain-containing protein n=1 Tax=Desulfovibrio mangrovi TaxID=2976983 RepID=UPI0022457FEE|nr:amphi-Trp domain-containing protein [Desulfovibrio mangrovi]UZP67109.1 amphi-Trp domain-containing protein [Desulfovibrio mangrovi]